MRIPKTICALCLIALFTMCRKKKQEEIQNPLKKTRTVTEYHSLSPTTLSYYNFKDGSYWVFSDSTGQVKDSLSLTDFKTGLDTVIQFLTDTFHNDIYETISYTLKGNAGYDLYFKIKANTVDIHTTYLQKPYVAFSYVSDCKECTEKTDNYQVYGDCKTFKDSLRLKNGKIYANVSSFVHRQVGVYNSGVKMNGPDIKSKSCWVANIGVVQLEGVGDNNYNSYKIQKYELLRYNVNPR
jgi:hypothetical protein